KLQFNLSPKIVVPVLRNLTVKTTALFLPPRPQSSLCKLGLSWSLPVSSCSCRPISIPKTLIFNSPNATESTPNFTLCILIVNLLNRDFAEFSTLHFLAERQPQATEIPHRRIVDLVKRLEEALFKAAATQDEYLNLETLESRLHVIIKRPQMSNNNPQRSQYSNSSAPLGTMIPTPGMPQHGNSNMISSTDNSTVTASTGNNISAGNSAYMLPTENGSSAGMHGVSTGSLSNGYQQSHANFSVNLGGNNIISSMGGQRVMSQMIPTPGFTSNNNNTFMNIESAANGSGFSNNDSSLAPQRLPQKQSIGNQNSSVLQSLGNQMGGGMRSSMQMRSYPSQDGSGNGGFGSYIQPLNGSGPSENYLTASEIGGSPKSLHQQFDQQQQPLMQGDGYALNAVATSGSGNFFTPTTSVGSMMNNQNFNQVRLQPRSNLPMSNQPNLQNIQPASQLRQQSNDRSEKMSFQNSQQSKESLLLPHQHYQQQSNQLQQQPQFALHQSQNRQSSQQNQVLIGNDALHSSQVSSVGHHVKTEHGIEPLHEGLQSQVSGQFQLPDYQNQFPQSSADICPTGTQFSHDMSVTLNQNSQQLLQSNQLGPRTQTKLNNLPIGSQSESLSQGQYHPESDRSLPGGMSHELKVQEEFRQRISGHDDAQCNNLPCESSFNEQNGAIRSSTGTPNLGSTYGRSVNANRERQYKYQQKWLLFLRHARRCAAPEGKCVDNCINAQKLCKHMDGCNMSPCPYPRCHHTKVLINHHKNCKDQRCPVCIPVKNYLEAQLKAYLLRKSDVALHGSNGVACKPSSAGEIKVRETSKPYPSVVTTEDSQPLLKRLKAEPPSNSISPRSTSELVPFHPSNEAQVPMDFQTQEFQSDNSSVQLRSESSEITAITSRIAAPNVSGIKDRVDSSCKTDDSLVLNDTVASVKQEIVKAEKDVSQIKQEDKPQISEPVVGTKSGKPKIKGVSMTELFTPEQVRDHIRSLRQWVGQSKTKAEKNQAMEHSMSENSCQLCAVEKLTFEPPPIYCSRYGCRIKRNAMYYTFGVGDTRHYFCIPCYNEARGDTIMVEGTAVPKSRLEKKKNDEETEEWWVQCDKCEAWQHQICALFNGRRNDGGQAEYTCPNCYIEEIENGERKPLPQSAVLGAKDLPRTILSDHIEQRLFKRLKYERQERARVQGKSIDEVPGADGIVVRVVSSVDKKLEVKPRFLEIFREENYPLEFPYKSKAVLLFQKIEGVEVCLFGMYVQEFGSEALPPNQRRVYLSYLDSVKYFRPEVKAVTGEALRTFVYHEILIGYLEYCKKRGFTSCYIWACPPLKGEDYILYCHPEIQKTPKYLAMLKKATKENIVVELTNFYDHFFVSTGECKAKVTAARLPYFDGDYWPGAAEEIIEQLNQEEDGRKQNKKGTTKKAFTKRALKASGQSDLSSNASKDLLLMHKLGDAIMPMKDDFIMVHLQYSCSHCCTLMVSGNRWVCKQCKSFYICDDVTNQFVHDMWKCNEAEQKLDEKERHPMGNKDTHNLYPVEISGVQDDTKDKDEILESEFFDTRQAFLSLCQGNHYQYDTLRRAKHSSMMVLYHLHNPTAPAFVITCNICHLDIESGQGWRCETCSDYDVCNACYQKEGGIDHPHKLTNHPSLADRDAQNKEARQQRVVQLRKMLDLLVHASQCRSALCQYPNCRKVKGLFRHGIQCKVRASAGCVLCKKMWYLLQLHARACKETLCHVPRCRDLREHLRRLQQQSDSRRRAAVMEMMRQRAAEVAGNSG
ncbi:hypothetical protein V2J09_002991, partial [Rumex salicifolius]